MGRDAGRHQAMIIQSGLGGDPNDPVLNCYSAPLSQGILYFGNHLAKTVHYRLGIRMRQP